MMRLNALMLGVVLTLAVLLAACGGSGPSSNADTNSGATDGLLGNPQPNSGTLNVPIASMEPLPSGNGTFRYRESPEAVWIEFTLARDGTSFDIDTSTQNINHARAADGTSMEIARGLPGQPDFTVLFTVNVMQDGTLVALYSQGDLEVTSGDVPEWQPLLSNN